MTIEVILAQVAKLVPIVASALATLKQIRSQTEADHPQVWAKVRDDFKDAYADLQEVMGGK